MAAYDDSVCEFIEFLWEAGLAASYAGNAVSGVQFFLRLPKNALAESLALLTIWKRHEQSLQAPSMPVTVATALVAKAWTAQQCDMAVLVCLMYAACLRPEEALPLNWWQLEFSANARALAIRLPVTKMTKRGRAEETVLVHDELALRLTWQAYGTALPRQPLLQRSRYRFRRLFERHLDELGVRYLALKPYSCYEAGPHSCT